MADGALLDDLLSRGCFIDEPSLSGRTALMIAARRGHKGWIRALLERGADPTLRDSRGRTALHFYLLNVESDNPNRYREGDYESIVLAMISAGASPTDTDNEGDSPLRVVMRLSEKYKEEVASLRKLLEEHTNTADIKIARSTASKESAQKKWDSVREDFAEILPNVLVSASFPLFIGGMSIWMREGVYRDNYSSNFMGIFNSGLNFSLIGYAAGFVAVLPIMPLFGVYSGPIGSIIGFMVGLILSTVIPSITRNTNASPMLYYLPTVASAIIVPFYSEMILERLGIRK
jgi:hypothetical protein